MITVLHQIRFWGLLILLNCVGNSILAQDNSSERFELIGASVVSNGSVTDVTPYLVALENINLDRYRLLNASRILKFESGVEIELISGEALAASKGQALHGNLITKDEFFDNPGMILQLHSSGRILEKHFQRAVK